MGRGGSGGGVRFRVRVRITVVSPIVFLDFLGISFPVTLEPHVGHTKFTDFYVLILHNNPYVR